MNDIDKPLQKWFVVVPTNRPEKFQDFYNAWYALFKQHDVHVIIVEDAAKKSDLKVEEAKTTHLCWDDIPNFIPRKTDMIRSWGFYKAWELAENRRKIGDMTYVLTLDDDVVPGENDPFARYELQFLMGSVFSEYFSVGALTDSGLEMRGFPYKDRKRADVAVQYGGWSGVLDYDAATQLAIPRGAHKFRDFVMPVPKGAAATCCIMNTAFAVEYVPIMWQLTLVDGRYNRVGDIWSGLFIKKTLDILGKVLMINGSASITHDRASDPYNSLQKEAPSVWLNDHLWENLNMFTDEDVQGDMIDVYREVTDAAGDFFAQHDKEYAKQLIKDRDAWLKLFR